MLETRKRALRAGAVLLALAVAAAAPGLAARAAEPAPAGPPAVVAAQQPTAETGGSPGSEEEAPATGTYKGVVTNRRSGKPVSGAVLLFTNQVTGDVTQATTGDNGAYEVELPAGSYLVDIKVGRKDYRTTGTFHEEAGGKRWLMDFTVGSKLTEKDLKIETTPSNIRIVPTEPRPPLQASKKMTEFLLFLGGVLGVAALAQ